MRKSNMRKSKYDDFVGEIFSGAKLVETRMVDKTSKKTGKAYRVRRFWMTADGEHTLEIGTQSFKNESYFKRLDKITTKWIYTTFDEVVKEEDDVEFKVDSFEDTIKESVDDWYESWKKEREFDDLHYGAISGKELASEVFKHICKLISEDDNMNVAGQTIYHSPEELFEFWNSNEFDRLKKELDRVDTNWNWDYAYRYSTVHEWRTEYSQKLYEFIKDEWDNLEERRRNAQKIWRDKVFGTGWEERWERRNFGSIDTRVNKYDEVFKDLTPKEAKRKMRELSKQLHPDVHPELDGTEFTAMHDAYERHMSRVA